MALSEAHRYDCEGVVFPLILRKHLLTTAAVDNIEHKSSSMTAQGAFHRTRILTLSK